MCDVDLPISHGHHPDISVHEVNITLTKQIHLCSNTEHVQLNKDIPTVKFHNDLAILKYHDLCTVLAYNYSAFN